MSTDTKTNAKTYRYKFSKDFLVNLKEFSRIHKFMSPRYLKIVGKNGKTNKTIIEQESNKLKDGYQGDV